MHSAQCGQKFGTYENPLDRLHKFKLMPRRRSSSENDVSLFPFLSIIACVIGVLTMMIATIALAQTDNQDVAQIEAYEKSKRDLDRTEKQINSLRQQLEASDSSALETQQAQKELEFTLEELEELLAEMERIDKELAEQKKVQITVPPVDPANRETLADMKSQYADLKKTLELINADLTERKSNSEAKVTVLPQGTGLNFTPYFVECTAGAVVMHHLSEPKRIWAADIGKDADFLALLDTVANGVNDTIVFLIRNDGLGVYWACKRLCDTREIRNGKLPVVGKGRIDLAAFASAGIQPQETTKP
jgi:hypothetical protein